MCIRIPLGTEVGHSLGDIVLDEDPAALRKKAHAAPHQIFGPCLLWPNSSMDQDASWYGVNLGPGDVVLDGVAAPPKRGTAPSFRFMSVVAKRLDG